MLATATPRFRTKKLLTRRFVSRNTRRLRPALQIPFLLLNVSIAAQFYFLVRQFEIPSSIYTVSRPPGVEGWLPIAGLMNLKSFLLTREIPALHPATMFLLTAFLAISWVLRKAFRSWLCPVGTRWSGYGDRPLNLRPKLLAPAETTQRVSRTEPVMVPRSDCA